MSDALFETFTPIITIIVLNTSDAECTASDTIAPERANIPANILNAQSTTFSIIVTADTLIAICLGDLYSIAASILRITLSRALSPRQWI